MRLRHAAAVLALLLACSADEEGKPATSSSAVAVCKFDGASQCTCTPGTTDSGKCGASSFSGGTALCCATRDWNGDAPRAGSCSCSGVRCVKETGGCRCGLNLTGEDSGTCTTSSGVCCVMPSGECYCKYPAPPQCAAGETRVTSCPRSPDLKCPTDRVATPACH